MNKVTLNEFLDPFNEINSYLKALQIISSNLSTLKLNYTHVAQTINALVEPAISINKLCKFIERVHITPDYYGLTSIKNMEKFTTELKKFENSNQIKTRVLIPKIDKCIFCEDVVLILKPQRFAKAPILYTQNRIGIAFV